MIQDTLHWHDVPNLFDSQGIILKSRATLSNNRILWWYSIKKQSSSWKGTFLTKPGRATSSHRSLKGQKLDSYNTKIGAWHKNY